MPFVNRFVTNQNGAVTFTGNTLGLSRSNTVGVPGTVDSIGAFITTDTSLQFGTYPPGTTNNFAADSSSALLVIPPGSTILYAELIWGGTYIDNGVDLSAFIDNPVTFATPSGTFSAAPDPATSFNVQLSADPGFPPTFAYSRSSVVTNQVSAAGAGTYTTSGVAGTIVIPDPTSNHAGWTLAVIYQNPALPFRNLSLRVGATVILSTSGPVNTIVSGFATPYAGALNARALFSAQEGDANKSGDRALFGPALASLTALSGPNNFAQNFFASQINKDDGTLDTSGTFGLRNQTNGQPGTNIVGGRQGWDITNVNASSTLFNNQTSAVLQLTTNGDGYLVNANALQIDINIPLIEIVKTADETIAAIGDIVTYTVTTRNTSEVDATNAMFFDQVAAGSSFVDGSVIIDNVPVAGADPTVGFPIGDLPAGASVVVEFQVRIDSLPDSDEIRNQAQVAYDYKPTPDSPVLSNWVPSNIVRIPVVDAGIAVVKSADTTGPVDVGDIITFTLDVTATGNTPVTTTVTDLIPQGAAFVSGSVTIGGIPQTGADPAAGINLGILNPGDTVTVTFRITVSSFPESGNIVNQATDIFTFQAGPRSIPGTASSNIVRIPVNIPFIGQATLTLIKASSLTAAVVGDVVTYTVNVQNLDPAAGTVNVLLLDPIPAGSAFVPGSVTVNGVSQPQASPVTGIPLGNIGPLTTVPVTFQVTVTTVPVPPVLINQATANYASGGQTLSSGSNIVSVPVYQPALTVNKLAGAVQATVGQTVVFTLLLQNTGNIAVTPVVTDIVPPQASFIADSLRINGVLVPGADPAAGITLEPLVPGGSTAITFDIVVNGLPPGQLLTNQASAAYTYQPSPGRVLSGAAVSNPVTVLITVTGVTLTKSANLTTAVIGDVVTYELVFTNTSTGPVTAVVLSDPAVEGAVFVPGTVVVNGVPDAAAVPADGIVVGTVPSGGVVTVTYRQRVDSRPANSFVTDQASAGFTSDEGPSTVVSNPVNIAVAEPSVTLEKRSDTRFALIGDLVLYSLVITNTGNYNVNVFLSDPIPPGSVFVPNSLMADGTPLPGVDPSEGEFIGTIEAGNSFTVTFLVEVVSVPPSQALINRGTLVYEIVLPDGRSFTRSLLSNEVNISVAAPPQVQLLKSVNTNELDVGMLFVFTLQFLNPGPFPVTEATLLDPLPAGLVFTPGSVTLDGTAQPAAIPSAGIPLGTVPSGRTAVVTFTARASAPQITVNQASAVFTYLLPDGRRLSGAATSNPVRIRINENEE